MYSEYASNLKSPNTSSLVKKFERYFQTFVVMLKGGNYTKEYLKFR